MSSEKQLLNKQQIARRYGVSTRTITSWMQRRVIPFTKPSSRMVRFDPEACDEAISAYEHASIFKGTVSQELQRRLTDRKHPFLFTSELGKTSDQNKAGEV